MKRHTLVVASYCDHTYRVTIGTDIGEFTGEAFCRIEDRDHESEYFGYELAELKAEIQYARAKRKHYDAQLQALCQFWREMSQTRTFDTTAFWVQKMRIRVDDIEHKRNYWADRVNDLKEAYHNSIVAFDTFNKMRRTK